MNDYCSKSAQWVLKQIESIHVCSNCGEEAIFECEYRFGEEDRITEYLTPFCPFCGRAMENADNEGDC